VIEQDQPPKLLGGLNAKRIRSRMQRTYEVDEDEERNKYYAATPHTDLKDKITDRVRNHKSIKEGVKANDYTY
jgi:hypothetical protein